MWRSSPSALSHPLVSTSALLNYHPDGPYCHFPINKNRTFNDGHRRPATITRTFRCPNQNRAFSHRTPDVNAGPDKRHAVDAWKWPDVKCLEETFCDVIMHQPIRGRLYIWSATISDRPALFQTPKHPCVVDLIGTRPSRRPPPLSYLHLHHHDDALYIYTSGIKIGERKSYRSLLISIIRYV